MRRDVRFAGWPKRPSAAVQCARLALFLAASSLQAQDCPIVISRQPESALVLENCRATFDVGVASATPVFFLWFRDGAPIDGATNSSYAVEFARLADNGSKFHVVVANASCAVTSSPAILYISADVVLPSLSEAKGGPTLNTVAAYFVGSCGLVNGIDPVSGTDIHNYSLSGGLAVSNAMRGPGGTNVILTTSPQVPSAEYTLYVENVMDLSGNRMPIGSHVTFRAPLAPSLVVTQQPQSVYVLQFGTARFTVGVSAPNVAVLQYQWQRRESGGAVWTNIPGATNASYSTQPFPFCTISGPIGFRCYMTSPEGPAFSDEALAVVIVDGSPLQVLSASGSATLAATYVVFSELVERESAEDIFNYAISNLEVISATRVARDQLGMSNTVRLVTSPQTPGATYTIRMFGIRDLGDVDCGGSIIAPGTQISFQAWTPIRLSVQYLGTNCVISWDPPLGTLQVGDGLESAWTPVPSATSPHSVLVLDGQGFYRVVTSP